MSEFSRAPALVGRLLRRGRRAVAGARGRIVRAPAAPASPASVTFLSAAGPREAHRVERGETLLQVASRLDMDLDHFCGGRCSCGTCRVVVVSGGGHLSRPQGQEQAVLGVALDRGDRLACQARIEGAVEVRIPEFFGV